MLEMTMGLSSIAMTGGVGAVFAQEKKRNTPTTKALDEKILAANRELDRRLLEAHKIKDAEMVESLFSDSPNAFFISPGGSLNKRKVGIRKSFQYFFDLMKSVEGDIKEISYIPLGDGVLAVGTVIYSRQPKKGDANQRTVIWTDYRRLENGRWVYFFRHAHWSIETINPADTQK